MVLVEEAKNLVDAELCGNKIEQETLLSKYGIPVQHLDFAYIEKCRDSRELEKIVQILRSGEEGHYPDLTKVAENRLSAIKPKSKLLRKAVPVLQKDALNKEERLQLDNDIKEWVNIATRNDTKLGFAKNQKSLPSELPEIREITQTCINTDKKTPSKRISSTDYSSWDKYDADTEILKMDLQEENIKKTFKQVEKKKPNKKTVKFKNFTSDVEALHQANYEKDKGNEFFKAGEYHEALRHYTNSISCTPTLPCLTNRALTYIKLKKFNSAIDDCHSALAIDPNNIKALLRKAQALENLGQQHPALETVERLIKIDPNHAPAQELAEKLRKHCGIVLKNTRFSVQDINSKLKPKQTNTERRSKENKVIIPIPGPSNMSPPYYVICTENNPEKLKEEIIRANTPNQIIQLVSVDSDGDDDDSCTINHLKKICSNHQLKETTENNGNINKTIKNRDNIKAMEEVHISKSENRNNINNKTNSKVIYNDKRAGGEPYIKEDDYFEIPEEIHTPYSFLKAWVSASYDETLEQQASILRSIDMNRIVDVIGCKLDNGMFSTIVKCLCIHFAVPGEVERLHFILDNLVNLPRFEIISMLMSTEDRNYVNILIDFLKQHGKYLSQSVVSKFLNP